ncbi:hypothetical protein QYF36_007780 [Acer negundo]|nr:hypothetical protein QYF36_007780 [Acer negundo]
MVEGGALKGDEVALLCIILWRVWSLRNVKVHAGDQLRAKSCDSQTFAMVYVWSVDFLASFRDANGVDVSSRISVGLGVEK